MAFPPGSGFGLRGNCTDKEALFQQAAFQEFPHFVIYYLWNFLKDNEMQ